MHTLLRLPAVLAVRGRRKSAHYSDVASGLFPKPVAIGARSVAWPQAEVAAVNAARVAGKTDAEIRELVCRLHEARGAAK